jgi:hypothetical protein
MPPRPRAGRSGGGNAIPKQPKEKTAHRQARDAAYKKAEATALSRGKSSAEAKASAKKASAALAKPPTQAKARKDLDISQKSGPVKGRKAGDKDGSNKTNETQKSKLRDKLMTPAGLAALAALGITLAVATAFIAKAAMEAQACEDCRDFKINITSMKATPSTVPLIGRFLTPSTVDVSYTCPTDYKPIEGKETFTFKDTGIPEMDNETFVIAKVLGNNKVQVKCGSGDCSTIDVKKGSINPNCADFNARFNKQVEDAAAGVGDGLGALFGGFFDNMGTYLFVIGICFLAYFVITALSKSKSKSSPN